MADQDHKSALPIRSEADGLDERVQTKIVDATDPDNLQMEVDSDNNAHVEVHGNRADDAADVVLQLSEEGRPNSRGDYEVDDNSKPASSAPIMHQRKNTAETPTEADQLLRPTGVTYDNGVDETVVAQDVALRDEDGVPYSQVNPLPVSFEESEGDEVHDFNASATAVPKNGSDTHTYTVPAGKVFLFEQAIMDFSADCKMEIAWGPATAEVRNVVRFGTKSKECSVELKRPAKLTAGQQVVITRTNNDQQPGTMYSTIIGLLRDA